MDNQMGARLISPDFLGKSHIGQWVIEVDEGYEPRMYADEEMLRLLGVSESMSPEEIYKLWNKGINPKHCDVVDRALRAMSNGEYKEIQYLWRTGESDYRNVRTSGIRNQEYTKGIRIEGIHRDVTAGIKQKSEAAYNSSVIKTLASDYLCVFTADVLSEESKLVFASPVAQKVMENVYFGNKGKLPFNEMATQFCNKLIHPEDMKLFMDSIETDHLLKKIREGQHMGVHFRASLGNKYRHILMNFYPYSYDSDSQVVIGIKDVEDEFLEREKIDANEKMRLSLLEDAKTGAVLTTMTDDFDIVAYIDYTSGDITPYRMAPEFLEIVRKLEGAITKVGRLYSELHKVVYEDDVEYVLNMVRQENVLDELSKNKTFMFDCRVMKGGFPTYYRVKYAHDPDNEKSVIIGLQNVDAQIRKEMEYRKGAEFRENARRVMELSEEFECIYDINVDNREFIVTTNGGIHKGVFPKPDGNNMKELFGKLGSGKMGQILEEDRPKIVSLMGEGIAKRLDQEGIVSVDYRRLIDGEKVWYRIKATKSGDWINDRRILIGIFNNDRYMKNQEERRNFQEICNALSTSFESLYYVNTEDDTYFEYNTTEEFAVHELELTGKDFFESSRENLIKVAYPEDLERTREFFKKDRLMPEIASKEFLSIEYRLVNKEIIFHYRARVLKTKMDDSHILVAVENIEDEVAERQLRQQQMEEALQMAQSANRAKTAFLNNMSHDIRTPMNAIIGFTGLATTHIDNKEQVKDYLQKISQSSEHLLSLINDVLDMSRIESGKMNLDEKEENLKNIISSVRDIVTGDVQAKKMIFTINDDGIRNEAIVCDRLRLSRVLINTISNAIKYTPVGGTISFDVDQIEDKDKIATYRFVIRDNGIGMKEEFLKTIFDPFTRVNSSTVSGIQGTGLGMAITKNIVDMMKGKINIKSKENQGTEVVIVFSFKQADTICEVAANPENKENDNSVKKLQNRKILLVEDNELNREIAVEMLEDAGFVVDAVEDGIYAVEVMQKAKEGDYDLVLMDIQMPLLDGYEATRKIRAMERDYTRNIPIIAMTANAFEEDKKAAIEAGMNEHIAKPIEVNSFIKTIEQFFD